MRNWLIDRRNEMVLTQMQVATRAGIARSTYAMIELGKRTPSVPLAKVLGSILGIRWTLFFEGNVAKCESNERHSSHFVTST